MQVTCTGAPWTVLQVATFPRVAYPRGLPLPLKFATDTPHLLCTMAVARGTTRITRDPCMYIPALSRQALRLLTKMTVVAHAPSKH